VAAGRTADARTAYQEAFTALDPKSPYRGYVQVKLDTVGGPIASATGAPVTAPAPAPAPPAPAAAPAAPAAKAVAPAPDMPKK